MNPNNALLLPDVWGFYKAFSHVYSTMPTMSPRPGTMSRLDQSSQIPASQRTLVHRELPLESPDAQSFPWRV